MDLEVIYIKDDSGCLEAVRGGRTEARRNLWVIVPIRQPRGSSFLLHHSFYFPDFSTDIYAGRYGTVHFDPHKILSRSDCVQNYLHNS